MAKTNKKIEMWEEDRGWIYWCDNCGKKADEDTKVCSSCYTEFMETERY